VNVKLSDLADLTHLTPLALRERIPFGDQWVSKQAGVSLKALRSRLGKPIGDPVDRQIAAVLFRWVYEGRLDDDLPLVYSFRTLPLDETDDGGRIGVLCPLCATEYMLGSVEPYVLIDTNRDDRKLVFYHGHTVQCPRAQAGNCLAPREVWKPRLVRFATRPGPGAALDPLLEAPHVESRPLLSP